jgi:hypothetical protein
MNEMLFRQNNSTTNQIKLLPFNSQSKHIAFILLLAAKMQTGIEKWQFHFIRFLLGEGKITPPYSSEFSSSSQFIDALSSTLELGFNILD